MTKRETNPTRASAARPARARGSRRGRRGEGRVLDLEAIGLVLLALGVALGMVLWPRFPSGEVGGWLRGYLVDPVGWGAWWWPGPFVVLGTLFLLRRSPPRWPWVLLGYAIAGSGAWGLLMLITPAAAGVWGVQLRATLAGAAGVLAFVPAVSLLGLGIELMLAWRPGSMARAALLGTFAALRSAARSLWRARTRARAKAAFRADIRRVRRELRELDLDLAALAGLYPGSGELERWRGSLQATVASLRGAEPATLDAARADVAAWRGAVGDFARDRAREIGHQLRAEQAQPPSEAGAFGLRGVSFDDWARHARDVVDEPLAGPVRGRLRAVALAEGVRRALALDLTGLVDRHRRLLRERDLADASLESARPRDLAPIAEAHGERVLQLQAVEKDAFALAADAQLLDGWRALLDASLRALERYPDDEDLQSWDEDLSAALRRGGRGTLVDQLAWSEALRAAEIGARERLAQELVVSEQEAASAAQALGVSVEDLLEPAGNPLLGELDALTPIDDLLVPDDLHGAPLAAAVPSAAQRAAPAPPAPALTTPRLPRREPTVDATPPVGGLPLTLPPVDLLDPPEPPEVAPATLSREQRERVARIDATLSSFKLQGRVVASVRGPTVTRFEVEPAQGEKISRFANLADDLALAMAVASVRIEAPIPGKSVIGLEVPNSSKDLIRFREGVEAPAYQRSKARLPIILGKSIDGEMLVGDLVRMPHLLIAGSTGSGKSIAVNTLVASLLYRFLPTELRFLMIDPKMVELTPYDGVPHLIRPVVTNPGEAAGVLLGAVSHMERRYKMMSRIGVKNLDQYNAKAKNLDLPELPFIVIVIDELADLMITSPKEVESAIMRLAQMARATGMHLILATQRPSVDILTSLIKVNVPARMAFAVSSGFDSRTILDTMGAERLLGRGDMLYHQPGLPKPLRLQGPFMAETEIAAVGDFLRRQFFDDDFVEAYASDFEPALPDDSTANGFIDWNDDKLRAAAELVITEGEASVSRLQRRLQVGHARAGKLMDSLENLGVVGPHNKSKARDVLVTLSELPNLFGR